MFKKLGLYYRAAKHLKPIQIRYRLWYILRSKLRKLTGHNYPLSIPRKSCDLEFTAGILKAETCKLKTAIQFTFLNQSHTFEDEIDWNFDTYGKLWAYNLNYFDYLGQESIEKEEGLKLIQSFINYIHENREGIEPYPIALRGINWIKFLSNYQINNATIDASLHAQYQIILDNLEYHLLGNHLLEDGFSLLFGAFYFQDDIYLDKSKEILYSQLEEQVLDDGAHYERSTMYQRILLERLLDCINLLKSNTYWKNESKLKALMTSKAQKMLGWLQQISFGNGDLPQLNDATPTVGPKKEKLETYAQRLKIEGNQVLLNESGYRKYQSEDIELLIDVGKIGPDYQPAHAHSDTLSFILYYKEKPVFVDTGISTYEENDRRNLERGTEAHNTVKYGNVEQSEVWKAFRVGRRAKPTILAEGKNGLKASQDGYQQLGINHVREWKLEGDSIQIFDSIKGNIKNRSTAYFHIHPDLKPYRKSDQIFQVGNIALSLRGILSAEIKEWLYPQGFNQLISGYKLEITFNQELESRITRLD